MKKLFLFLVCFFSVSIVHAKTFSNYGVAANFGVDAESSDAYVITVPGISAYVTGMIINFSANTANTGACSIDVNGLGAKSLKSLHDQDPADNYIESGSIVSLIYDGTNFQVQTPDANP